MDQQNRTPDTGAPRRVPSEAEIARAEAEAVARLQRGEAPSQGEAPSPGETAHSEAPAQRAPAEPSAAPDPRTADFVPYVDDVPEPEPEAPAASSGPDDDDDGEYIPSEWEKRIDALPPEKWRLYQILGGAVLGLVAIASLFVFGEELSTYGLIVAALLALIVPRYLERAWRRKLTTARYAMVASMLAGLLVMGVVTWLTKAK